MAFTGQTLGSVGLAARLGEQSVDGRRACGQPFQEAAALLVDPEDEPDDPAPDELDPDADGVEPEPEPDDSEEDDDDDSVFFCPPPSPAFASFASLPVGTFAASRLSVR